MDAATLATITDVDVLRALVTEKVAKISQHVATIEQRDRTIHARDLKIEKLTHELARLRRVQFAAKSERMDSGQRELFDEAMAADLAAVESELAALRAPAPSPVAPRKTPQRRALPADLPRIETIHAPASCDCATCGGALVKIGEHVSEKLDCQPIVFFVRRDIYPQYACKPCQTIVAEPVAPAILDRGLAAPGLLAQVVIQKYTDHLPLYRQEAIFARSGIELSRTTLAEWIGVVGLRLQPLVDALHARLLTEPILHADETPVAQLDPGAGKTKRAYLFAYAAHGWASVPGAGCAGATRNATAAPIVVFDYCASRAGKHAKDFLGPYRGALMVDDYAGYKALFEHGVTELGCWAHAGRTFFDAHKASASPLAEEALRRIGTLYAIEATVHDLADGPRRQARQRHAQPLLDDLKRWLDELAPKVLGNTGLSKAIAYTRKRWPALVRYLDDCRYPIDNNPIENAIRPIALGRKNWLFAGSHTAGQRAAAIMSLLATAKVNGIEPHAWLTDVLTRLPTTKDRDIAALLPPRCKVRSADAYAGAGERAAEADVREPESGARADEGGHRKKVVTPVQRREAVSWLRETKTMSERCACRAVRQPRATQRRRHRGRVDKAPEAESRLSTWRTPIRRGAVRSCQQLSREGHRINHKRTERLYGQHGLAVRRRRRRRLSDRVRQPLVQPLRPNQCWSMDFMSDSMADGRAYRTFNVIDDYARDALGIEIDVSLTANRVVRVLDQLCEWHGTPEAIRSDNGPEFRSEVAQAWAKEKNIRWDFIQPGCPAQNAYIERFNGTYRLEVLDANAFRTLDEARAATADWLVIYNEQRTHSTIGHLPPLAFKQRWQQREFPEMTGVG